MKKHKKLGWKILGWTGVVLNVIGSLPEDEKERARKEKEDLERFSDGLGGYDISGEPMSSDEAKAHRNLYGTDYDY